MHKRCTVLLVENNVDDARLAELAFERAQLDHALMILPNGSAAVDYLTGNGKYADRQKFPLPKLVLLDLAMPGVDGFEVLQLLRRHDQLKNLPVTVFSGSDHPRDKNRAYELGANSFLVKPTEFEKFATALKETVDYWVGTRKLQRAPIYLQVPQQLSTVSHFIDE